jgi:hypothetical protein
MKELNTIHELLSLGNIYIPDYQRAYSWDVDQSTGQVNQFLKDLRSTSGMNFYIGHFLFQKGKNGSLGIIDGQQRLTTVVIFLSVLQRKLIQLGGQNDRLYTTLDFLSNYNFKTVSFDNSFFRELVFEGNSESSIICDTYQYPSQRRIFQAYSFFEKQIEEDQRVISNLANTILSSFCTYYEVLNYSDSIQVFLYENNRGKQPSDMELIKAEFIFHLDKYGGEYRKELINALNDRFGEIQRMLGTIEDEIKEGEVLMHTMRVFFNSLRERRPLEKIKNELAKREKDSIDFVEDFSKMLEKVVKGLNVFFKKHSVEIPEFHFLKIVGSHSLTLPFILKAYFHNLADSGKKTLAKELAALIFRNQVIKTRARLSDRLEDKYREFSNKESHVGVVERIQWMINQKPSLWYAHWNKERFIETIQNSMRYGHKSVKYILWSYELFLQSKNKGGYSWVKLSDIEKPEVEHISPQTAHNAQLDGYSLYDEEFKNKYLNSIGNLLLISKKHNCSASNAAFEIKRSSYNVLSQQKEIQDMTKVKAEWLKEHIEERERKIKDFVINYM